MRYKLIMLSCFIFSTACNDPEKVITKIHAPPLSHTPLLNITEVEPFKKFPAFWGYFMRQIKLNEDFVPYDDEQKPISKTKFLSILASGEYQPIVINPIDSIRYQLKKSPKGADSSIADYMKMYAKEQKVFYAMEGKLVPKFDLVTINGDRYTSENTKGKIILFKCWFIACVPCVQEIPQLNTLVESNRSRNDILFLSLAIDDTQSLNSFFEKTKFNYQTVAKQAGYMSDRLKVNAYPTHFLIDKAGRVVKVSNSADEVEMFLKRILTKEQ